MIKQIKFYENGDPFNRVYRSDFHQELISIIQSCEELEIDPYDLLTNVQWFFKLRHLGDIKIKVETELCFGFNTACGELRSNTERSVTVLADLEKGISTKSKLAFLYLMKGPNQNLAHVPVNKKQVLERIFYGNNLFSETAEKINYIEKSLKKAFKEHSLVIDFYVRFESQNILIIDFSSPFDRLAFQGFIEWGDTPSFKETAFNITEILNDDGF